jgi:F420-non-reducing hydrogenase large subunit
MKRITIDPITRLEGHGKIEIFLNDDGSVANAYLQVPELRGFEQFAVGRPVEEMPRITSRICGVCPEAHLMAAAKACDEVYGIVLPPTAAKLRELQYCAFTAGDHTTHFYALGGPDFVMGPDSDPALRNVLGVIGKVGLDLGKAVIQMRLWTHEVAGTLGGKNVIPINAIPGGMSKGLNAEERKRFREIGKFMVDFSKTTFKVFEDVVLKNSDYVKMILSDPYVHKTYNMGLVDENNRTNFYDGVVRIVGPDGKEHGKYEPFDYAEWVAERVEPWTYLKFPYLKKIGWKGFVDGVDSGVYKATPLSRCNVADSLSSPLAQAEYEKMYDTLGGKPAHHTLATHWARIVEIMNASERFVELINDDDIIGPDYRVLPTNVPSEGVGTVEAPRGTLTHHYVTDEKGIVQKANLIVGTTNNHAAISMSIVKAAKGIIKAGEKVSQGTLNRIEMAYRAYDPCFGCATHALGRSPMELTIRNSKGEVVDVVRRNSL